MIHEESKGFLLTELSQDTAQALQKHENTRRPFGNAPFIERLEVVLHRDLTLKRAGGKPLNCNK